MIESNVLNAIDKFIKRSDKASSFDEDIKNINVKDLTVIFYNKSRFNEIYVLTNKNKSIIFIIEVNSNLKLTEDDIRTEYIIKYYSHSEFIRFVERNKSK